MTGHVAFRPRARQDILDQLIYLTEQNGTATSNRYQAALLRTCGFLAQQPAIGTAMKLKPRLQELRRHPVARPFGRYLIFYKPSARGIDVWRVLHGARDIDAILLDE